MPPARSSRRRGSAAGHFVGREVEQRRFRSMLSQLNGLRERKDDQLTEEELTYPQLFLVAAEGGMGKTTLMRRFEAICNENREGAGAKAVYVDLERYGQVAEPDHFMRILHDVLCEAGFEADLKPYRETLIKRSAAQQKAADAEEKYRSLLAGGAGYAVQVASHGMIPQAAASKAMQTAAEMAQEMTAFIRKKLSPDEWKLYEDPQALTEAFMECVAAIATPKRPLVLLLDTYEVADRCDKWLRERALARIEDTPRLIVAVAGREGQPFIRRYEDLFPATLIEPILLDTFARPDVVAYVQQCGIAEPGDELIDKLQALSRGIPLALEGWFNLYQKNVELPPDPAELKTREAIVRRMTDRFLRYCNEDDKHLPDSERKQREATRNHILSLMLLRRTDVAALAAAWQCSITEAEAILNTLADQFSFIFAQEIEREPHALVKQFLREHVRSLHAPSVALHSAIQNLVAYFESQRREREQTIVPQGELHQPLWYDDDWREILFDGVNASCWSDKSGKQPTGLLLPFFLEAAEFLPPVIPVLLEDVQPFTVSWHQQYRNLYQQMINARHSKSAPFSSPKLYQAILNTILPVIEQYNLTPMQECIIHLLTCDMILDSTTTPNDDTLLLAISAATSAAKWVEDDDIELGKSLAQRYINIGRFFLLLENKPAIIFPEIIRIVKDASRLEPNEVIPWLLLGLISCELHQIDDAVFAYQKVRTLEPKDAKLHTSIGVQLSSLEQYETAVAAFQHAIALDPTDASPYLNLGMVYASLKQFDKAIDCLQQTIALDPSSAAAYHILGEVHDSLEQYEAAILVFQQALDFDSTNAAIYFSLGRAYSRLDQYEAAISALHEAIALDPSDVAAHRLCGASYILLHQHQAAIPSLKQAIDLDPNDAKTHRTLGIAYIYLQEFEAGIQALQQAITLDPSDARTYFNLGAGYIGLDRYEDAVPALRQAAALDPTNAAAYRGLGMAYSNLEQYEEAIPALRQAIVLDPMVAEVHFRLGRACNSLEQYEVAIPAFQQTIALDPTYAAAYYGLGVAYDSLEQYEAVVQALRQGIDLKPNTAAAHTLLGMAYSSLEQYEAAIPAFQQAIALKANNAKTYALLGRTYFNLRQYPDAIGAYQQAIALDPVDADSQHIIGNIYSILNRVEEARAAYQRAVVLDPENFRSIGALARIERQAGKLDEASKLVSQALALVPVDDFYNRACQFSIAGDMDAALAALQTALESQESSIEWARIDPDFVFIRDDPRYRRLVGLDTEDPEPERKED